MAETRAGFRRRLQTLGYSVTSADVAACDGQECAANCESPCSREERTYSLFLQTCACCVPSATTYGELRFWCYEPFCAAGLDTFLSDLGCGGHYTSLWVFEGEALVEKDSVCFLSEPDAPIEE